MKHEWRKKEKGVYLPKNKPVLINVPTYTFLTIAGTGNPNSSSFADYIGVLYALSYAIKMTPKKMEQPPVGYYDYTVYPLEGVWDITEEAKKRFEGTINKDDLVFQLMIRQPDFLKPSFFEEMLALTQKKKPNPLLEQVQLEEITEGSCIQMLHVGPYEDEDKSFALMETFAAEQQLIRTSKIHREIYLSDFRKVAPEKLKTVLRFQVHS